MSQLRKHLKFSWINRFRALIQKTRLGHLGKRVFLDKSIELLRFPKNIFIKDDVVIKEGAKICSCNSTAIVRIGERTTVGYNTFIFASEKIEIGNDCMIAPFVYIVDSNHQIAREIKINQQPNETAPIRIEDDVWIASNVTILKGVTIATGAVIAANSVLNQSVPAYEIWGGSPAKKIGERK
ncbi:acetyltransferase-like isoleucine patch superfamily enzyme [Pedobacter metabolipauper]|uniref:Acetyltransferase-like isoleucine patch superfamily enzyme n=1 Tax=Pedobacter metabolipauper TaxID=425513 RepID=A0A4R6SXK4_9SPHI|nr:acetyltransferase-like isoleucine patch superfamily enzyme [Pedobacter metabolipauper]